VGFWRGKKSTFSLEKEGCPVWKRSAGTSFAKNSPTESGRGKAMGEKFAAEGG